MEVYKIIHSGKGEPHELVGRLLAKYKDLTILLATPTKPQEFKSSNWGIRNSNSSISFTKINLLDEKWIHPHLYKPLKDEVKSHLTQIIL